MKGLLRLYPRAWRERYGTEMEAVLAETPFDPRTALDLVACAVDAHLHPREDRQPLPLAVQAALLIGAGTLAIPFVIDRVEPTVLSRLNAFFLDPVLPAAVAALAAFVSWRAGWALAAWFCGLVAVQRTVLDASGMLFGLFRFGHGALEPLRLAAAPLHPAWFRLGWLYVAALVVVGGLLIALFLRRMGVGWPFGLGTGVALLAIYATVDLNGFPFWLDSIWDRFGWLAAPAQALAWGMLTAAILRGAGLRWPASLLTGAILWLLLGSPWFLTSYVDQLSLSFPERLEPGVAWAAAVAALVSARGRIALARALVPA